MAVLDTRGIKRPSNRTWAIAAALLWVVVAVLAGFYLWEGRGTDSAAGQTTVSDPAALAAVAPGGGAGSGDTQHAGATETTTTTAPTTTASVISTTTSAATSTTSPPTTTTTEPPPLVVAAGGDVLGDRKVGDFIDRSGGEAIFAEVKPFLETAQIAFVNMEGPISDKGSRATWKEYTFRMRPALIDGLVSAGIDVVSLANNHSMDYGAAALLDTLARLEEAGVNQAGAGANATEAAAPAILISPAGIVAVLAYTEIVPGGFAATSKTPGVNTTFDQGKLLAAIAEADKIADFVIVSFHWGTEYTGQAGWGQQKLAHQVVDAGADLVLGHHPHVIQGLEIYKDRLIAYSLGDFVWDHYSRQTGEAFVLRVTMPHEGPPSGEIVPVYLDDVTGVPAPVTGSEADVILSRLARFSADLGLELSLVGDRAFFGETSEATTTSTAEATSTTTTNSGP